MSSPKFHKRILKSDLFNRFVARLAWGYIKLVKRTSSWTVLNEEIPKKYLEDDKPFILVFWHNRLLLNVLCWTFKTPIHMLISKHSDGRLISQVMTNFHIHTIAGSTNKEGVAALRLLLKTLKSGHCVGITPDGPRGPRFTISDGTLALARLSGADIIPCMSSTSKRKILSSWDRFLVGLPFSKGCFAWGDPLHIPRKATKEDLEILKEKLFTNMIKACDQGDNHCGHQPFFTLPIHKSTKGSKK